MPLKAWPLPLWVFLAGGLGSLGRWAVQWAIVSHWGLQASPAATALVNLSGCLAFGVILGLMAVYEPFAVWRPVLLTGFLGGWTTFSTWIAETVPLAGELDPGRILGYGLAQWLMGCGAYWLGLRLAGYWAKVFAPG